MAKIDTKTVFAVGGGVALVAYLAKKTIDNIVSNVVIELGVPQLDNTPFAQGYINLDVPVTITNNNPFPINVKYFHGLVTYGPIALANISFPVGFSLPAGLTKTINLDMAIPITQVFNDVLDELASGNIWDVVLNKIYLNGTLQLHGNFTNVPIQLEQIPIPIT